MGGAEQRPFGLPNFARDGAGGGSGKGRLQLLPGKTPLGEPILRRRPGAWRQPEQAKSTLGQEMNAYLAERARLRAEGLLPTPEDKPPIITPADAISLDLFAYDLEVGSHPEEDAKGWSISKISWGFDALAFGLLSQAVQEYVTVTNELGQGLFRNYPHVLEAKAQLNGEEAAILAEQLHKVGLPFEPLPAGITIPFAPTVQSMRTMVGGEPLFPYIPPPNLTHINKHPRRNR